MPVILLTRDSVAVGDHVAAPHNETIDVPDGSSTKEIILHVLKAGYLETKIRKDSTWSIESGKILSVFSLKLNAPLFLDSSNVLADDLCVDESGAIVMHCYCHGRVPPRKLFYTLKNDVDGVQSDIIKARLYKKDVLYFKRRWASTKIRFALAIVLILIGLLKKYFS
jgi:hypothetical protein